MDTSLGSSLAGSLSVAILIFLVAAYLVGQLLSPAAKLVQRIGEDLPNWIREKVPKAEDYDWLRLHYPAAGDQCAKIRAEFTMHNGLAVLLLLTAIVYPLRAGGWRWYVLIGLVLVGLAEFYRGRTTRDTFHEAVKKFRKAADQPPRRRDVT